MVLIAVVIYAGDYQITTRTHIYITNQCSERLMKGYVIYAGDFNVEKHIQNYEGSSSGRKGPNVQLIWVLAFFIMRLLTL